MIKLLNILCFLIIGVNDTSVIDEYLQKNLTDFNSYEYEIVTDIKNDFTIDEDRKHRLGNGYMHLPVLLIVNDNYEKKSSVTLKIKLYKEVLVAAKDIKAGEEIHESDFVKQLKNISRSRSKVISDESLLVYKKAKRNIHKGDLLSINMLRDIPLVKRGDMVNAFLEMGTVVVSFRASSRGIGSKGDRIRIERDDKRIFIAEVVDKNNVKIIE